MKGNKWINDISALFSCKQLEVLDLSGTCLKSMVGLFCNNLKKLSLAGTRVKDILALSSYTELEVLDLSNTDVKDITTLCCFQDLRDLGLAGTKVKNISDLSHCKQLEFLDLSNTDVEKIEVLSSCKNLKTLGLNGTKVKAISVLSSCKRLNFLDLSNTEVKDLSSLTNMRIENLFLIDASLSSVPEGVLCPDSSTYFSDCTIELVKGNKTRKTCGNNFLLPIQVLNRIFSFNFALAFV